jgi:hypothetical protein
MGACFDVCHAAVLFEDIKASLQSILSAGITLGKIQLSSALALQAPHSCTEKLDMLRAFAEPRYLHQTVAVDLDGSLRTYLDLPEFLADFDRSPRAIREVRSHFHVPVDCERPLGLDSTQAAILETLSASPMDSGIHFEVETYTHHVLPGNEKGFDLVESLVSELEWVQKAASLRASI